MNKAQTLEAIEHAKAAHEAQMIKIQDLLDGLKVSNPPESAKTKCAFGLWFHDDSNKVKEILGAQFYDKIDKLHSTWHVEYLRIFEIFFSNKRKGFFSKIIGSSKVEDMELDKAKLYYSELLKTTDELLKVLEVSRRRVSALSDSKFS